jgi:hypothetical protein
MFSSSTDLGLTKMCYKSSNLQGAEMEEECLRKSPVNEDRNIILMDKPMSLYPTKPGLREIKQVELYTKYLKLVPKEFREEEFREECCPKPAQEVVEREKNKRKAKGKIKRKEKKEKKKQETVTQRPTPIVTSTTASTSNGDAQEQPAELTSTSDDATSTRTSSSPCKRSRVEAGLVDYVSDLVRRLG